MTSHVQFADMQAFAGKTPLSLPLSPLHFTFLADHLQVRYQIVCPLLTKFYNNIGKKNKKNLCIHGIIPIKVGYAWVINNLQFLK